MVDEFGTNAIRELDYTGEAYNSHRLTQNMAGIPGVHIPKVFAELSTDKVLTMEFIRGVKISNLEAIDQAGLDREMLAKNALRAIVKQLLIDGFFHADPHPGNVLVELQTGNIAFIDTGMVGELELAQRLNIIQLLIAVQQNDVTGMASVMKSLSTPFADKVDEKAYYKDFERTIGRIMISGGTVDFGHAVSLAMDLLRQHGLRLDPNLTLAIKALMQAQAIALLLFPGGGIVADGVQMIREEALKAVTAERLFEEAVPQGALRGLRRYFRRGQGGSKDQPLRPATDHRPAGGGHGHRLGHRHGGHRPGRVRGPVLEFDHPDRCPWLHLLVAHRRADRAASGLALAEGQPAGEGLSQIQVCSGQLLTHHHLQRLHSIISAPCRLAGGACLRVSADRCATRCLAGVSA